MKLIIAALLALTASTALACPRQRNHKERYAFVKAHPCPSTGKNYGACPGYVVDHIVPLCLKPRGDKRSNLQWQTLGESQKKDVIERAQCRAKRNPQ